ncbi:Uncharacterized protein At5g23160 [Linum perenne]
MDDAQSNNPTTLPTKPNQSSTVFSGRCLRCSSFTVIEVPAGHKKKKKKRWLIFPSLSMKKNPPTSTAAKTFPLESSSPADESQSLNTKKECVKKSKFNSWKTNCMVSKKFRHPPAAVTSERISAASLKESKNITAGNGKAGENGKNVEAIKSVTCKKRLSFCRKTSVDNDIKIKTQSSSGSCRTHPASTSNPKALNGSVLVTEPSPTLTAPRKKEERKLGSVVGISIITVTLVIMVVWGRLCAIVCMSGCLYFVPRLRTYLSGVKVKVKPSRGRNSLDEYELGGYTPDLDSAEYKRRVVLEGFLDRNRRPIT